MKSIELNEAQKPFVSELENLIRSCEDTMAIDLENSDITSLLGHLRTCQTLMSVQSRIVELSTLIYGHVKGLLIEEFKQIQEDEVDFYKSMKVHEFRLWADGKMSRWEALYLKSERVIKSLDRYNENLRTLISAEKQLTTHLSGQV